MVSHFHSAFYLAAPALCSIFWSTFIVFACCPIFWKRFLLSSLFLVSDHINQTWAFYDQTWSVKSQDHFDPFDPSDRTWSFHNWSQLFHDLALIPFDPFDRFDDPAFDRVMVNQGQLYLGA